jgi:putative DNA methylase
MNSTLPKRLIEVDLPIRRISDQARREKDMRRGHIPLLHIYPAARPPAACRAVMCAALWPDPADPNCPESFREVARLWMLKWANEYLKLVSGESLERFVTIQKHPEQVKDNQKLRGALLDFIADFANWDNGTLTEYLTTSHALTHAAHTALNPSSASPRPIVLDSFAGGGAIPLEAARLGADVFASDSSPVAVLLNKVILELVPTHGEDLVREVSDQIKGIKAESQKELCHLYPVDPDGAVPTTYIWARTIRCEGPACGATVPLIRSPRLVRKGKRSLSLKLVPNRKLKKIEFRLISEDATEGTVRRGSVTCPICNFTTPVDSVRRQLVERRGGASDAQLIAVVTTRPGEQGRTYRLATDRDLTAIQLAKEQLLKVTQRAGIGSPMLPNEAISLNEIRRVNVPLYGMTHWADLFTPRQLVSLSTFCRLVIEAGDKLRKKKGDALGKAVQVCLAILLDKLADMNTSLCVWQNHAEIPAHLFGRWAIGMVFDFAETNPLAQSSGSPEASGRRVIDGLDVLLAAKPLKGHAQLADATHHPLPNNSVDLFMVDPPYYDAIPYAHLMDFFYVWLRRCLADVIPELFTTELIQKESEIVVDRPHKLSDSKKDVAFYEREMQRAFADGRRVLQPNGLGIVIFASKTTASWEAILQAIVNADWVITGSWPIDTEMESRVAAQGQARLASSVHLVCRPRVNHDGSLPLAEVGDWRDVLSELPHRIHEWMPRLAAEGVVGADAIFACLGPALEIFSRFSSVEKASGETVSLAEYLEHVWAAVAKEALATVFKGADASGFEEDARLTAMWLWTLFAGRSDVNGSDELTDENEEFDEASNTQKGYDLEYDAARKIAQGLGAHLESLTSLVEIKGETATLLSVAERTRTLFGKDESESPTKLRKKKKVQLQLGFIAELEQAEDAGSWGSKGAPSLGATVLDRVHQSMILFAAGRGEALRRFLVDEGVGRDERFWRLAQVLSFLYPKTSDEKRWIDGVLARKKGLGF